MTAVAAATANGRLGIGDVASIHPAISPKRPLGRVQSTSRPKGGAETGTTLATMPATASTTANGTGMIVFGLTRGCARPAVMPDRIAELCITAGCPKGGTVLDPFGGAGTTGLVADRLGRNATLIELNPDYAVMARRRISGDAGLFAEVS